MSCISIQIDILPSVIHSRISGTPLYPHLDRKDRLRKKTLSRIFLQMGYTFYHKNRFYKNIEGENSLKQANKDVQRIFKDIHDDFIEKVE